MKKVNIIIIVGLIVVCAVSWFAITSQTISQNKKIDEYVAQADEWVSKGLYQRAIKNYEMAAEIKPKEDIFIKAMKAYDARYEEAPDETIDDYIAFMETAVSHFPANHELVDKMVLLYTVDSNPEGIYNCLTRAIHEGYDSDEIQKKLAAAQYAFTLKRSEFSAIKQSVSNIYSVSRKGKWNIYDIDEGYLLSSEYENIGLSNADGIVVITGKDSRIVDANGMVMGIFKKPVSDAGLYADGLLPACTDGKYSYYDEFAEEQFGGYEMASAFQDGKAAVKTNGSWQLIDTNGKSVSDQFEEIVLNPQGQYLINGLFLAKNKDGVYCVYDEKLKEKAKLDCSDVDCISTDGIIAFCKDSKWGFVNTSGEVIIQPEYNKAKSFSNGLAAVYNGDKWGFINKRNQLAIDYQFIDVGYMGSNGLCPVRTDKPDFEIADSESGDKPENTLEIWKFLELSIGIKED